MSKYLHDRSSVSCDSAVSIWFSGLNILEFKKFSNIQDGLLEIWSGFFEVYTNSSLKNAGFASVTNETTTYFSALDISIGIGVYDLLFSTMAKLQTVGLFLECVLSFCKIVLHLNSQAAINACMFEMLFAYRVKLEKAGLVEDNSLILSLLCSLVSRLSNSMVKMLGIIKFFAVSFSCYRPCFFFSGLDCDMHISISV
ncbi:hypothetical protein G9A89_016301 [Geosiphon pyriformis]|nr:hypothetical protein G9A89_016301 [Geosiphon pyriformis]